jgi:hypothetical protein
LSADRLSDLLKVRKTTMAGKAKRIRDVLDLDAQMDVEFCRLELLHESGTSVARAERARFARLRQRAS